MNRLLPTICTLVLALVTLVMADIADAKSRRGRRASRRRAKAKVTRVVTAPKPAPKPVETRFGCREPILGAYTISAGKTSLPASSEMDCVKVGGLWQRELRRG